MAVVPAWTAHKAAVTGVTRGGLDPSLSANSKYHTPVADPDNVSHAPQEAQTSPNEISAMKM
jgi:hypothetical protein